MPNNQLIDIVGVAEIFNLSIETIRKYKQIGLIRACKTIGRKDYYEKAEVLIRKKHIESLKQNGTKIADITTEIKRFEEALPKQYNTKKGQKRVLIIEDEGALSDILVQALSSYFDEEVLTSIAVEDGATALEMAKQFQPDLIIMDIVLDNSISGMQLHLAMENEPALKKAEYIFMSGNITYQPDNTIFLEKPFSLKVLKTAVEGLLGITARNRGNQ